ncbi:Fic family protein [Roseobacter sp. HKCCD9010]|uniref:Fic family protein n=1 Tax=unclassified Roseobacter TaxID=196798 RepID=UPI0014919988|nr:MULTISPECIES: Fic family protein [unclassified Roseobacter]MBF9052505.1 Fic family protein [Rhodobacterales bacterium HKCCD4356]NNV40937.1 Fic family protein [Roseobacter sp. HKCCD9054]NNV49445.1 Fic family protein [Roseobacter sp. HKCCD6265]NNV79025.1 Fic family protein [Roseobacter sp. HKCCD6135]NNV87783.1 Fic family protein [Roseobacter sp. HKCCD8414]NNW34626.1 Fic family protein [Roseobacter sp. HKCCD8198]NNW38886.1 Fic family protein [Roseobacter sp. HKCCD9117-2]NNW60219.1 Fic famil
MAQDEGESIGLFEPLMVSEGSPHRGGLNDLALELAEKSAAFRSSLPESTAAALADLVRAMNCYYSNLIEGHNTHPIDIERALDDDYSTDPKKRDLQLEAKAHITVQKWIDEDGMAELPTAPASIIEMHRRFCELVPEDLLWVEYPGTGERVKVVPGELRERYVEVGRHVAVSPGAVPRFMDRMHEAYARAGRIEAILAAACAHHRLLWVHPFLDGNGRVARLMSYAMLRNALDTRGLWSVARGLARQEQEYKAHLQASDGPRRGDRDGRGTMSEAALASFTEFFLRTSIDQVEFMRTLMQANRLRDRIMIWAEEEMRAGVLPPKSDIVLKAILFQGVLERGEVDTMLGMSDRAARRITSALLKAGAVTSDSTRAPLYLAFPAKYAERWMPGLFPAA